MMLPGQLTFSHGTPRSRGVILGVHSYSDISLKDSVQDPEGRYIVAECQLHEEFFTVVSVYFDPLISDDVLSQVLSDIARAIDSYGHNRIIWMGDFNSIIDPAVDSTRTRFRAFEIQRRLLLKEFRDTHDLTDVWRVMHPFIPRYTHMAATKSMSRLDYFLASPAMLTAIVRTNIEPQYLTDHNPISLSLNIASGSAGKGYWKFPDFLLRDKKFREELPQCIKQTVSDNIDTEPGLLWDVVKSAIRGLAIDYLARSKQERKKQIEKLECEICTTNQLRDSTAHDPYRAAFYADKVKNLQSSLDAVYDNINAHTRKWAAARKHYESNRCTKYYFRQPGRKNDQIKTLYNSQGIAVSEPKQVLQVAKDYYQTLYRKPQMADNFPLREKFLSRIPSDALSQEGINLLGKEISLAEVYVAMSKLKKDSVPGEDGLTVNFYLTFWNEVKDLLFASYNHAFECGHLSITQRRGLIRLIPKVDKNPLFVSSWRPISLLNVDYKAVTKLFALQLATFLPNLIHSDQKGFIMHRSAHENLVDVQAIIAACESEPDTEAMLVLLDIQKAFDSIGWNFLKSVLIKYNFPDYFIAWFDIFYTGKELHILNNGCMSEVIFPERGVTQGCGISPLYFVLALEVLALALHDNDRIVGIPMGDACKKLNLLADDALLALKWTNDSFKEVLNVLEEFSQVSFLKVNEHKSWIIPLGRTFLDPPRLGAMKMFPIALDSSFRYLGIDWSRKNTFLVPNHILESEFETIQHIACTRSSPDHSMLGRILTVKALMVPRFTYKLHTLASPPASWFHKVQSFLNDYIWAKGPHRMRANLLYQPVPQGGFNMLNVALYDRALKLSWLNRAKQNPNAPWVVYLESCLILPLRTILSCNIAVRHIPWICKKKLPHLWMSVLTHWCEVHFTKSGGFIPLMPLKCNSVLVTRKHKRLFFPSVFPILENLNLNTVQDFLEAYEDMPTKTVRRIEATYIMDRMPDAWLTQQDSGFFGDIPPIETLYIQGFTVKQCYSLLIKNSLPPPNISIAKWEQALQCSNLQELWPQICKNAYVCTSVKLQTFHLKFINRYYLLNTRRALWSNCSELCSICNKEHETFVHAFWDCTKIHHLWVKLIAMCEKRVDTTTCYSRENCLLIGFKNPLLTYLMIICKYHIHLARLFNKDYSWDALFTRISNFKVADLNAYSQLPCLKAYKAIKLWKPLFTGNS